MTPKELPEEAADAKDLAASRQILTEALVAKGGRKKLEAIKGLRLQASGSIGAGVGGVADRPADDDVVGAGPDRRGRRHHALLVGLGLVVHRPDAGRDADQLAADLLLEARHLEPRRHHAVATRGERAARARQHELADVALEAEVGEVACHGSPLVIGIGADGHWATSDAAALPPGTRRCIFLADGDVAELGRREVSIVDRHGCNVVRTVHPVLASAQAAPTRA